MLLFVTSSTPFCAIWTQKLSMKNVRNTAKVPMKNVMKGLRALATIAADQDNPKNMDQRGKSQLKKTCQNFNKLL